MRSILIVGSTSTVGLAVGSLLAKTCRVAYAGRKNADYFLDLNAEELHFTEDVQFDVVIHAAADFGGPGEDDIFRTEKINALGTLNICRLARKLKARQLIVISTLFASYVAGDPYFGIYSLSKRHADELAELYCRQFNLPLTILRPSQLYDADSKCRAHQGLLYSMIDKAEKGEDISIYGNHDASRNFLFVDDFSEIVARVIDRQVTGTFNCSALDITPLSELANTAYRVFEQGGNTHFLEDKPAIADLPEACSADLYEKIDFKPRVSLAMGIQMIKNARAAI